MIDHTKVLQLAAHEAEALGHYWLGCEHLLLGLLADTHGVASAVLSRHGLALEAARDETVRIFRREDDPQAADFPGLKWTPRATVVVRLADIEAERLGTPTVGTGHLLLALMTEGGSVALRVLTELGVDLVQLRSEVLEALEVPGQRRDRYIRERETSLRGARGQT
jgi:ATP-dependent Clp protease ATP-binding subunit ClpC